MDFVPVHDVLTRIRIHRDVVHGPVTTVVDRRVVAIDARFVVVRPVVIRRLAPGLWSDRM